MRIRGEKELGDRARHQSTVRHVNRDIRVSTFQTANRSLENNND
jgi:hypothetical protein